MNDIIREARELCERATPGPWDHKITAVYKGQTAVRICGDFDDFDADARFIARSRTLIPELLDLLAERDAEIARLTKALHKADIDCDPCKHNHGGECENADFDCMTCDCDCICKSCRDNSNWEWRGAKEELA